MRNLASNLMQQIGLDLVNEDVRVGILRQISDLGLVNILTQPSWHMLCDAPMQAYFLDAGLPQSQMTQALESGDFLADGFAPNCNPKATLVIATRRSELAVLGVMQRRKVRAMGLFRTLLPRLIAKAPPRINMAEVMAAPHPKIRFAIIATHCMDADLLAIALTNLGCGNPIVHLGAPQLLFAKQREVTDFEPLQWWKMLLRTQSVEGVFGTVLTWPELPLFLSQLAEAESDFLKSQIGEFTVLRIKCCDLLPVAVLMHLAATESTENTSDALVDILRRFDALRSAEIAMDDWLSQTGARTIAIDHEALCVEPTETASVAARHVGITPNGSATATRRGHTSDNPRFAQLLALARDANKTV